MVEIFGSYLTSRRGAGAVLAIAAQDLSALVDKRVPHSLRGVVQDATESCGKKPPKTICDGC